jgi:hypothetical protein
MALFGKGSLGHSSAHVLGYDSPLASRKNSLMPIHTNGPVLTGTRRNLIQGLRAAPMMEVAVDAIIRQAVNFTERVVDTYESQVAHNEVGAEGSGRASVEPIAGIRPPTALMYGRVQSGKTAAMILSSALCLDNGFRVVVVLTANSVALVNQTASRFKAIDGPRVLSTEADDLYEWEGQEDELRQDIASDGLVLVCAKDAFHLPRVIQFLQNIEASAYPAIVFDDEADAATPDTTLAARSSGRPTAPTVPSTINRRVIENLAPGEEGQSISEILPHSLYVQVTATPFILFLQRHTSPIRPNVTFLLEPGEGYRGGESFFAGFDAVATRPAAPIVLVPDAEALAITRRPVPQGLAASIDFFLVAAAAAQHRDGRWPQDGFKHLSHTSARINQHTTVANHIDRHILGRRRELRRRLEDATQIFADAYAELQRSEAEALPALGDLSLLIYEELRQAEVLRINANTNAPSYGPRVNFLVGGNILGRGLTIDDLLVTYYVREAQTAQMDTVWQHARMYGYRAALMPYTRVYLPRRLATRFKEIHESEEQLRDLLRREASGEHVPIRIAARSRPTRPNATEPAVLQIYRAGLDQLFPHFLLEDSDAASEVRVRLEDLNVPITEAVRTRRSTQVPLDGLLDIVDLIPVQDADPGRWKSENIRALMESFRELYNGFATVYVRGLEESAPPQAGWIRGRLSGEEIQIIRSAADGVPALALMYSGTADQPRGWYPTLVLPPGLATFIVNPW